MIPLKVVTEMCVEKQFLGIRHVAWFVLLLFAIYRPVHAHDLSRNLANDSICNSDSCGLICAATMPTIRSILKSHNIKGVFSLLGYAVAVGVTFWTSNSPWAGLAVIFLAVLFNLYLFWPQIKLLRIVHPKNSVLESLGWLYVFGLASVALVLTGFFNLYLSLKKPGRLTDLEFSQPYLSDKYIRLADLADAHEVIEGRVFNECWIYGPAVVFLQRYNTVGECEFDGSTEELLTVVQPNDKIAKGVITIRDSRFMKCHFVYVSFYATPSEIEMLRKGFREQPR